MSTPLVQAQREQAELELALQWLQSVDNGRREAAIAAQRIAHDLAAIKQQIRRELSPTAGYVIQDHFTHRVYTGVRGDLWSPNPNAAEKFFDRAEADKKLSCLRVGWPRRDRHRLAVEPFAKLQAQYHPPPSLTPPGDQP